MGVEPLTPALPRARKSQSTGPPSGNIDVVVLSHSAGAARGKILNAGEVIKLRAGRLWQVVPGEIATIKPARQWTSDGNRLSSGTIEATGLDARAIGLTPLRLEPFGEWDPAEEYWGERGGLAGVWAKKLIKRGGRSQFEMEEVMPGEDPDDCADPMIESNEKKDAGDYSGGFGILMDRYGADLRCLDAHAHQGNLSLNTRPEDRHAPEGRHPALRGRWGIGG
jgi:hypothetical protein